MEFYLSVPRLIIQCNFITVVTFILLSTFIFTNVSFSKQVNTRFLSICFSALFLTISDNIRFITANMSEPNLWRYISASAGYTIRPLIIFLLATLAGRRSKLLKHFWIIIPLIFNALIAFLSIIPQLRGLMFDFDAQNKFIRGFFGFLPYFTCGYYVCLIIHFIIKKSVIIKAEIIIIFVIILLGSIATAMESIFRYDLILSQVLIIGTVFYYMFLNVQASKRDTLTELENRRAFYLELEKIKRTDFCIISMDLNNLKFYNDTKGHAYGDEALITCADTMLKSFPGKCKLYRIGGDEFMAICKGFTQEQAQQIIKKFQDELKKTTYVVSCGSCEYHYGDDIEKVISISDRAMYENKKYLKSLYPVN